jgi:hypothetical protein
MTPEEMKAQSHLATQEAMRELGKQMAYNEMQEEEERKDAERAKSFVAAYARKKGEPEDKFIERTKQHVSQRFVDATNEYIVDEHTNLVLNATAVVGFYERDKEILSKEISDRNATAKDLADELLEEREQLLRCQARVLKLREKCKIRNGQIRFLMYAVPALTLWLVTMLHIRPEWLYQYLPINNAGDMLSDLLLAAVSTALVVFAPYLVARYMDPQPLPKPVLPKPSAKPAAFSKGRRTIAGMVPKGVVPKGVVPDVVGMTKATSQKQSPTKGQGNAPYPPDSTATKVPSSKVPSSHALATATSRASGHASLPIFAKERHAEFVFRIKHFYKSCAPEKLSEPAFAEKIAVRYAGREQELFDSLSKKYSDLRA